MKKNMEKFGYYCYTLQFNIIKHIEVEIIYNLIKNNINYSFKSFQYSICSIERSDKKIFDLKFDDDLTIGYTAFVYDNIITIYDNF